MKKISALLCFLFPLLLFMTTQAEMIPQAGSADKRIRTAIYDQDQVYRIAAKIGYASYIQFWEDEKMVSFFTGDKDGWDVGTHGTLTAFKPKVKHPSTNFVILTNKGRVYNILFDLNRRKTKGHIIGLRFLYPEEEQKKQDAEALKEATMIQGLNISYQNNVLDLENRRLALQERKQRTRELAQKKQRRADKKQSREDAIDPLLQDESIRNYQYGASGSDYLRPDQMFDNGRFTFIHFSEDMEWPAVFRVKRGKEYMINTSIRGNWLIIPRLSREWHLRLDDEVLCIKNTHYAPRSADHLSDTASEQLIRSAR